MIEHPDRQPFPPGEFALVAVGLGFAFLVVGEVVLPRHSWPVLVGLLLIALGAGAAKLIRGADRCGLCDAELHRRERYAREAKCWFCRIYTDSDARFPDPERARDARDRASRDYRLLVREAIRDPRRVPKRNLGRIAAQREAWQTASEQLSLLFRDTVIDRAETERWRLFHTYATQLISKDAFKPSQLDLLLKMMEAMTGVDSTAFDTRSDLQRLNARVELRGVEEGWVRQLVHVPPGVRLARGERLLWFEAVHWMDRPKQTLTTQEELGVSVKFAPGTNVSAKATLGRSIDLPPGPLQATGDVILAVTTSEIKLVGNHTGPRFVHYDQLVGVEEEKPLSQICIINSREWDHPIILEGRSGALMVAAIEFGYDIHEQGGLTGENG